MHTQKRNVIIMPSATRNASEPCLFLQRSIRLIWILHTLMRSCVLFWRHLTRIVKTSKIFNYRSLNVNSWEKKKSGKSHDSIMKRLKRFFRIESSIFQAPLRRSTFRNLPLNSGSKAVVAISFYIRIFSFQFTKGKNAGKGIQSTWKWFFTNTFIYRSWI